MKKHYLLMAAFASTLAFTACSNDDELGNVTPDPVIDQEVVEGATIEINLSSPANGATKGIRPMGNSSASNNVDAIKLLAYKYDETTSGWKELTYAADPTEGTNIAFKYISGDATNALNTNITDNILTYNEASPEHNPGNDTHIVKTAKLQVIGLQAGVKYQFVAIGYNKAYPYNDATGYTPATGDGIQHGVFQANVGAKTGYQLEEIFAANSTADAVANTGNTDGTGNIVFTTMPSLTLTRQVAGILAYFKDVPMYLPKANVTNDDNTLYRVEKLQIVANHKPSDFYFPAELLEFNNREEFNGFIDATKDGEDVLIEFNVHDIAKNATSATDATIDASDLQEGMNDFYTFYGTDANTGSNESLPYAAGYDGDIVPTNLALVENSIFAARYLLPYDKHYENGNTLTLRFLTEDDAVLQERVISTNEPGFPTYEYDIRCNNFYSIGQKLESDNTDDDEPVSLKGDDINVRINDAWAILHNMGVDNFQ